MTKVQRNWNAVRAELDARLRACELPLKQLSAQSGVSYYAIRRFKEHGVRNRSKSAIDLCAFFKIRTGGELRVAGIAESNRVLARAIRDTWDGSQPQAELLARLIRSAKGFVIQKRKHPEKP